MRFLFAIIGYFSVATLLAASLGLGYLWQSQRLTDEKVFRIVALVHGVEVDGSSEISENEQEEAETPPEEPSLVEANRIREIALRDHEVRSNALSRGRREFEHIFRQLTNAREQIDGIARELEKRIEEETELSEQAGVSDVVDSLKSLKPDKAKNQLLKILESGGSDPEAKQEAMDNVIRLLTTLPANTRTGILKKFASEPEQEQLHAILQQMLNGGPKTRQLEDVMKQIKERDFN